MPSNSFMLFFLLGSLVILAMVNSRWYKLPLRLLNVFSWYNHTGWAQFPHLTNENMYELLSTRKIL